MTKFKAATFKKAPEWDRKLRLVPLSHPVARRAAPVGMTKFKAATFKKAPEWDRKLRLVPLSHPVARRAAPVGMTKSKAATFKKATRMGWQAPNPPPQPTATRIC
jgi:hypothetical protein